MEQIFQQIKKRDHGVLDARIFSEIDLKILGNIINADHDRLVIINNLIDKIPTLGRNYDWNVGSVLQHIDAQFVIDVFREIDDPRLVNSIGLTWVFGEFRSTSRIIVDFLFSSLRSATNSDAWWRAAFSIEKLGLGEAINLLKMSLKTESLDSLDYYLNNINNKRSIISILILSNVENIEQKIYPRIKNIFLTTTDNLSTINCCWLIGRLKLVDQDIHKKLLTLISHEDYELKYYTFFAFQNNATESLRPIIEKSLKDTDPLIRKMAARGLMSIGNMQSLNTLNNALTVETQESVVGELSKAIYHLKNPLDHTRLLLEIRSCRNENGMISDESDKWYHDPAIYNIFSEAEDPENVCFYLIQKKIDNLSIRNPIDLATGTGRMLWQIINTIPFSGVIYAVDASEKMCSFLDKTVSRERKFTSNIQIINSTIHEMPKRIPTKSNFIISSFGFPSKISNTSLCLQELKSVYELLDDDGVFFTIGWDETFNDELSEMWFRFVPDQISAYEFEEWRQNRATTILSPRNCKLAWLKRGIKVPLQFSSLSEAALVMGYLFGRDAAQYVINNSKSEWSMSLGITYNTKKELAEIINTL